MDSLTQITLGAAVGIAVGGKKYGRKSALIGAFCGTLPDLDVLLFTDVDPVTAFTYHRGFSHSVLMAIVATPVIALACSKIRWLGASFRDKQLHGLIFLALFTHMILDALTIYGTQLFWPLSVPPVGTGSVFIIDPLYTVPLFLGVIGFLVRKWIKPLHITLAFSTLYLIWGLGVQQHVHSLVPEKEEGSKVLAQTTPFNSFLWRVLVMTDQGYKVGYYSILDKNKEIKFKEYKSEPELLEPISENFAVQRLQWFTKGFYKAHLVGDAVVMTDLRMGLEPNNYVFGFVVGRKAKEGIVAVPNQRYSKPRDMGQLSDVWHRIWNEEE